MAPRWPTQVELLTKGGVPVMAHIGFTPQSEHNLGGYRVQGRGETGARLLADAQAMEAAGAFAVVMEMVPGDVAAEITKTLSIPTIGIGAGVDCDAQVLVWQDMAGLRTGRMPRFVKQYANVHDVLLSAAQDYAADVKSGHVPRPGAHVLDRVASGRRTERENDREPQRDRDDGKHCIGLRTTREPCARQREHHQPDKRHDECVEPARQRDCGVSIEEQRHEHASEADEST